MIHCKTHNQEVTGYQIVTQYIFVSGQQKRAHETYVFDCGCEYTGAYMRTECELSEEETGDGTSVIRLQILDMYDNVVADWTESREPMFGPQ